MTKYKIIELSEDKQRVETDHGVYTISRDYKNDCWVVNLIDGTMLDFGFYEDCIEAIKEDLKLNFDDLTPITL
jgi:hypothetical protein